MAASKPVNLALKPSPRRLLPPSSFLVRGAESNAGTARRSFQLDEIRRGLNSRVASVRRRAVDRMLRTRRVRSSLAGGLSLFAPAARSRGRRRLAADGGKAALEREAAAEQAIEREHEAAASASAKLRLIGSGSRLWSSAARLRRRPRRLRACGRHTSVVQLVGVAGSAHIRLLRRASPGVSASEADAALVEAMKAAPKRPPSGAATGCGSVR